MPKIPNNSFTVEVFQDGFMFVSTFFSNLFFLFFSTFKVFFFSLSDIFFTCNPYFLNFYFGLLSTGCYDFKDYVSARFDYFAFDVLDATSVSSRQERSFSLRNNHSLQKKKLVRNRNYLPKHTKTVSGEEIYLDGIRVGKPRKDYRDYGIPKKPIDVASGIMHKKPTFVPESEQIATLKKRRKNYRRHNYIRFERTYEYLGGVPEFNRYENMLNEDYLKRLRHRLKDTSATSTSYQKFDNVVVQKIADDLFSVERVLVKKSHRAQFSKIGGLNSRNSISSVPEFISVGKANGERFLRKEKLSYALYLEKYRSTNRLITRRPSLYEGQYLFNSLDFHVNKFASSSFDDEIPLLSQHLGMDDSQGIEHCGEPYWVNEDKKIIKKKSFLIPRRTHLPSYREENIFCNPLVSINDWGATPKLICPASKGKWGYPYYKSYWGPSKKPTWVYPADPYSNPIIKYYYPYKHTAEGAFFAEPYSYSTYKLKKFKVFRVDSPFRKVYPFQFRLKGNQYFQKQNVGVLVYNLRNPVPNEKRLFFDWKTAYVYDAIWGDKPIVQKWTFSQKHTINVLIESQQEFHKAKMRDLDVTFRRRTYYPEIRRNRDTASKLYFNPHLQEIFPNSVSKNYFWELYYSNRAQRLLHLSAKKNKWLHSYLMEGNITPWDAIWKWRVPAHWNKWDWLYGYYRPYRPWSVYREMYHPMLPTFPDPYREFWTDDKRYYYRVSEDVVPYPPHSFFAKINDSRTKAYKLYYKFLIYHYEWRIRPYYVERPFPKLSNRVRNKWFGPTMMESLNFYCYPMGLPLHDPLIPVAPKTGFSRIFALTTTFVTNIVAFMFETYPLTYIVIFIASIYTTFIQSKERGTSRFIRLAYGYHRYWRDFFKYRGWENIKRDLEAERDSIHPYWAKRVLPKNQRKLGSVLKQYKDTNDSSK